MQTTRTPYSVSFMATVLLLFLFAVMLPTY